MDPVPAIRLHKVGFRRDGRWILHDLSWEVAQGSCAAILGPNGSGKSTLARMICGYVWPTDGQIEVLGQRFGAVDLHGLRRGLRLVQPASALELDPELTARDVVLSGFFGTVGLYDPTTVAMAEEAEVVLDRVGLRQVISHRFSTLSSGERMRCLIARSMVMRPQLLLLDEPTAGLDLLAREQVLATIQGLFDPAESAPTVIFITHHLEELPPLVSNVILLNDGRAAAIGEPKAVLTGEVLSPIYGFPMRVTFDGGRYYAQVYPGAWAELLRRGPFTDRRPKTT